VCGWVAGVDLSSWVGDFEGGVGEEFGVPAGGVEEVVVPGAQEDEVPPHIASVSLAVRPAPRRPPKQPRGSSLPLGARSADA